MKRSSRSPSSSAAGSSRSSVGTVPVRSRRSLSCEIVMATATSFCCPRESTSRAGRPCRRSATSPRCGPAWVSRRSSSCARVVRNASSSVPSELHPWTYCSSTSSPLSAATVSLQSGWSCVTNRRRDSAIASPRRASSGSQAVALRPHPAHARAWGHGVAGLGEAIAESRRRFVTQLQPDWRDTVAALSGLEVELQYVQGWSSEGTLLEALRTTRARDELRRLTHAGPHRGDVALRLYGRPAREVLSRGQQKLVAVAMTISQLRLLRDLTGTVPTLLLDDPAAELDGERLERFIEQVARLRCQLVVTSLHAESRLFGTPERTFRMEDGRVQSV